ncbi:unnamed protein product [Chironomus riparius]|uniref:Monocarboxylate transporter n=1 Tax=Chironomus riparius TaxID=315576 RepID=A0A9N9RTV2_9DIPT|nr:unnamed protein product [Chironomus riparius]
MVEKSKNGSNVYDIICYYKDDNNENQDHGTVHEVIDNIEQGNNNNNNVEIAKVSSKKNIVESLKWKLFGCFLMNVLLSSPIYGFITIYLLHKDKLDGSIALIWIPIIFNAVYLLVTPWLFNTLIPSTTHANSNAMRLTNRNVIIVFTLIMSAAISLSGFTFSYLNANFFLICLLYGVIGGMSSCVILGKMFVIINGILRNERLHLINFIYSFGTGLTQFVFPFVTHYVMLWFCHNCTILIIGALITHIIPIVLILIPNDEYDGISMKLESNNLVDMRKKFPNELRKIEESRYSDISSASYDFYPEMIKYPSDVLDMDNIQWKNPSNFNDTSSSSKNDKDDHFLEILDSNRVMNSDGVEILETITEEENVDEETKFPGDIIIDEMKQDSRNPIDLIYEEVNKKHEENQRQNENYKYIVLKRFVSHKYENAFTVFYRQVINPLSRSLKIFQFYPAVILKSIDIFSYLLFVTFILPNQAMSQYQFVERENVIYLITLMGLCWIIYSIAVLKFHKSLKQNFIHYFHLVGLLAKFFGYLFTNQRYSFNGFIFGIILISMGHANSFHLQETVIRNCFHPRKWYYIRGPIYSFSGFLILVYCIIFHILHAYLSFVTFTNIFVLFNLCAILIWLLTNYEMVVYVCSKY